MEISDVKNYGDVKTGVTLERVGSFLNMMNYLNSTTTTTKIINGGLEIAPVFFEFDKSREYILIFNQVIKLFIDGVEVTKTKENFNMILNIHKNIFKEMLEDVLTRSENVGFVMSK